ASVHPSDQLAELADVLPFDGDDRGAREVAEDRHLRFEEPVEAGVLDPDRVEHSGGGLIDARRRIARPRAEGHGLGDDPADLFEGNEPLVFAAVADDARGDEHRIPERERSDPDFEGRFHGRRSQSTIVASITGPSMHIAGYRPESAPGSNGTGQPRQAPIAQAMGP